MNRLLIISTSSLPLLRYTHDRVYRCVLPGMPHKPLLPTTVIQVAPPPQHTTRAPQPGLLTRVWAVSTTTSTTWYTYNYYSYCTNAYIRCGRSSSNDIDSYISFTPIISLSVRRHDLLGTCASTIHRAETQHGGSHAQDGPLRSLHPGQFRRVRGWLCSEKRGGARRLRYGMRGQGGMRAEGDAKNTTTSTV